MVEVIVETTYLMAKVNVQHREILTITSEGKYVEKEMKGEKEDRLEFEVRLPDGDVKLCTPNQTSIIDMIKAWGKKSEAWVGKKVAVKIENKNVWGEMKDVIYLVPLTKAVPAGIARTGETPAPISKEEIPIIEENDETPPPTAEELDTAFPNQEEESKQEKIL